MRLMNTEFIDVASATEASDIDGVHLDKKQHLKLGSTVTLKVKLALVEHKDIISAEEKPFFNPP